MTTAVWRCVPRSHGRRKAATPLPGRRPSWYIRAARFAGRRGSSQVRWNLLSGGRGIEATRRDIRSPFPPLPFPRHTRNLSSLFLPFALCARARARERRWRRARARCLRRYVVRAAALGPGQPTATAGFPVLVGACQFGTARAGLRLNSFIRSRRGHAGLCADYSAGRKASFC